MLMGFSRFYFQSQKKKISFLFHKNRRKADDIIYFIYECEPACFLSMHMHNNCFVKAKYTEMEKKLSFILEKFFGYYPKVWFLEVLIREMAL